MPATAVATNPKFRIVCSTCGSEDVVVDAWARWNTREQSWEIADVLDAAFCRNCDGECLTEERAVIA